MGFPSGGVAYQQTLNSGCLRHSDSFKALVPTAVPIPSKLNVVLTDAVPPPTQAQLSDE